MQCPKCGSMIEPGSMFCGVCGNKIETNNYGYSAPTNSHSQPTTNTNPYGNNGVNTPPVPTPTPNKPKSSNNNLPIIITILVVVVAVVAIFLAKSNSDEKPNKGESNNTTSVENYVDSNNNDITIPNINDYTNNSEFTTYFEIQGVTQPNDEPMGQNSVQRVVTADGGLRIRKQPNVDYGEKIGLIPKGTIVTVQRFENDWAYVTYEGVSGWCSSEFLFDPANYDGTPIYSAIVTSYSGVKMYSNPNGASNGVVGSIPYRATVYVYKVEGNWSYVSYNNTFGWCSTPSLY